ncbi:ribonuclease domain-containing protein [Ignavigranum ruoffiae]|uniref:Ribonuclease n=1 Tax=Ignavigranum ruoffiae TaxID=89093 RepID=A0A1H9B1K4_9LACT|nr:ribonuclease domain-containing protein [Ignavigranum ruoffiae]SEP82705.1 ribonuclease [Ignavigranum ruoffiae]
MESKKTLTSLLLICLAGLVWFFTNTNSPVQEASQGVTEQASQIQEDGYYYSKEEVAAYIHQYQRLPDNYISKQEAENRGWTPQDKEFVVGGNRFGNREGKLPKAQGRQYYEADLQSGYTDHRGPERLIYSNDGLIYYTPDHYQTFEQLY